MNKFTTKPQPIHFGDGDPDGDVIVYGQEGQVFLLTVQEVVNACGAWSKMAEFQVQMRNLMEHLKEWVRDRKEAVRDAYLSVKQGGGLFFMVVTRSKKYDAKLEGDLTDLDIEVANADEFSLLRVSVLAIPDSPKECVESFLTNC